MPEQNARDSRILRRMRCPVIRTSTLPPPADPSATALGSDDEVDDLAELLDVQRLLQDREGADLQHLPPEGALPGPPPPATAIAARHEDRRRARLGALAEPFVDDRALEAPLAADLVAGDF